jgi:small subunit ribosomal protein S27Ae
MFYQIFNTKLISHEIIQMSSKNMSMQLFIRAPTGTTRTYTFDVDADINEVKTAVEDMEFIPSSMMRVTHGTHSLVCGSLLDCGLNEGDSLDIMFQVNGGMKGGMRGKWKKKRIRRLRRKRRKMRQRAR